jgi:hypothetical protein
MHKHFTSVTMSIFTKMMCMIDIAVPLGLTAVSHFVRVVAMNVIICYRPKQNCTL